jgi:hypothetical protein
MAKAKTGYGGRRPNSGRKQSLSFAERMEIGSLCEAKWSAMSEASSLSDYESQPHINDVREEQSRLNIIPVKSRSDQQSLPESKSTELLTVTETIDEVSQEIDALLEAAVASRFSSNPIRRPQGVKEGLLEEVVESIGSIAGKKITKRMVKKCWDEFRSVQTRIRSELS